LDIGIGLRDRVFDKRLSQPWRMPPNKVVNRQNRIMKLSKKRERHIRTGAEETHQGSQVAYDQAESSAHASTQQKETEKHNGQQHVSA